MKTSFAVLAGITIVLASTSALSAAARAPASSSATTDLRLYSPPRELTLYGHVKSLARKGSRFELRFDPALWLGGVTASRAAVADKVIRPGESVPNDYYIRDEGHRLLTFLVPSSARATVITNHPVRGLRSTTITVSELAQIIAGGNPGRRPLLDRSNGLGFWIRVATDTVRSLDQQYQP